MGKEKFGYPYGIDCFGARDNDYPLRKAVVDHDQNRVFPSDLRKVRDKVYRNLFEGEYGGRGDGVQWRFGGVSVCLVLLAYSAALDESIDKSG